MPARIDWSGVDWSLRSEEIARGLGCTVWAVFSARARLGKGPGPRKQFVDLEARKARFAKIRNTDASRATAAAMQSPKGSRDPRHAKAKWWHVQSPRGKRWLVRNLRDFIRKHADEFEPEDVAWTKVGRGAADYCRAQAGLLNVKAGKSSTWKGWMLLPVPPSLSDEHFAS